MHLRVFGQVACLAKGPAAHAARAGADAQRRGGIQWRQRDVVVEVALPLSRQRAAGVAQQQLAAEESHPLGVRAAAVLRQDARKVAVRCRRRVPPLCEQVDAAGKARQRQLQRVPTTRRSAAMTLSTYSVQSVGRWCSRVLHSCQVRRRGVRHARTSRSPLACPSARRRATARRSRPWSPSRRGPKRVALSAPSFSSLSSAANRKPHSCCSLPPLADFARRKLGCCV